MMILISGGSGSGKSEYAERRAVELHQCGTLYYAATMEVHDEESRKRVARHRAMRAGKGFTTVEVPRRIGEIGVKAGDTVLIECMSNLLAGEMYGADGAGDDSVPAILAGIHRLRDAGAKLVIVTNEVFSDGVRYDEDTMCYIARLGEINRLLAAEADEVVEVVCGIPLVKKGNLRG